MRTEDFLAASDRMIAALTGLPPAQGFARIRLPGQGARDRERDYRAGGVPVRPEEWAQVERVLARRRFRRWAPRAPVSPWSAGS